MAPAYRARRDEAPAVDARKYARETLEVHRLFEAVAHRLIDEGMIGNLSVSWDVFQARGRIRKNRRH